MKLVIAALPVVLALAGLSVLLVQDGRAEIGRADATANVNATWEPLLAGLDAVDAERRATLDPNLDEPGAVDEHRRSTNRTMVDAEQALLVVAEESAALEQLGRALASLGAARTSATAGDPIATGSLYDQVRTDLVAVGRLLPIEAGSPDHGRLLGSVAGIVEAEQSARVLLALVEELSVAPVAPDAPAELALTVGRASAATDHAAAVADAGLRGDLRATGLADALDATARGGADLQVRLLAGDPAAALTPATATTLATALDEVATVRADLVDDVIESSRSDARSLAIQTWARVVATVLAIAVAVGLAVVVSRSITRRVREVSGAAQQVTDGQLPVLVEALRDPRGRTALPPVRAIDDHGSDEVSELARSFNRMQVTLGEVAREQLEVLQRGVSDLFVTMARRNRSLIDRQLALLDELEAREEDPATLEHFYRLDHLATRMRRHAESLLVLADSDSRTRLKGSASVDDIVRAAVSEVEDYQRIDVLSLEHLQIRGIGVADLTHLLAELLENATAFSPPTSRVRVTGDLIDNQYRILVIDEGMGIPDSRLEELNDLLAHPPVIGLSVEPTLGMSVVSLLAGAHGVTVELSAGSPGTIARIVVPRSLFERRHDDRPEPDLPPVSVRPAPALDPPAVEPMRSEPPAAVPDEVTEIRPHRQTRAATRKARRSERRSRRAPDTGARPKPSRRSRRHGERHEAADAVPITADQSEDAVEHTAGEPLAIRLADLVTAPSPTDPPVVDESPSAELAALARRRDDGDQPPHASDDLDLGFDFDFDSTFDHGRGTPRTHSTDDGDDPFEEFVPSVQPLPTRPEPLPRRRRADGDRPVDPFDQSAEDFGALADLDVTPSWARRDDPPRRPLDTPPPPAPTALPASPPMSPPPPPGADHPPHTPSGRLAPPRTNPTPANLASATPAPLAPPPPPRAPLTPPRSAPVPPPPPPPGASLPARDGWAPAAPPPTTDDRIVAAGGAPSDLKAALVAFDLGRRSAGRPGDVHGGQS